MEIEKEKNYLSLDARGTIIKVPQDIIFKSEVIKTSFNDRWKKTNEPYYLNYDPSVVHKMIDYLSGREISDMVELKYIAEELLVNILPVQKVLLTPEFVVYNSVILMKKYEEYKLKFNDFKQEIKEVDTHTELECFFMMLSYYDGLHITSHAFLKQLDRGWIENVVLSNLLIHVHFLKFYKDNLYWNKYNFSLYGTFGLKEPLLCDEFLYIPSTEGYKFYVGIKKQKQMK